MSSIYLNSCVYQRGQIIKVTHNNVHSWVVVKEGGGSSLLQMLEVLPPIFYVFYFWFSLKLFTRPLRVQEFTCFCSSQTYKEDLMWSHLM